MRRVILVALSITFVAAACTQVAPVISPARIIHFTIEPSRKQDGWMLYKSGAAAVLKGTSIAGAEVRYLPTGTGTGMGLEYPDGKVLGQMKQHADGSFRLALPSGLMTTNFWVQVKGKDGKMTKGPDLGNVADDGSKSK